MNNIRNRFFIGLVLLFSVTGLALGSIPVAPAVYDSLAPELPSICGKLQVQPGNEVAFHAYATGVQVYKWNGTKWEFAEPVATLSSDANYTGDIGVHYAGPTWESVSGSTVKAKKIDECSPDPTAIPWLLLQAVSTSGPGIFSSVTYIQRVNTTAGLPPATNGSSIGELFWSPYTAEYYFYRAED